MRGTADARTNANNGQCWEKNICHLLETLEPIQCSTISKQIAYYSKFNKSETISEVWKKVYR